MEGSGAQRQTQAAKPPQGRANSELPNVAPAEGGRPLDSELPNDNKAFRPQFDDQRE